MWIDMLNFLEMRKTWLIGDSFNLCVFTYHYDFVVLQYKNYLSIAVNWMPINLTSEKKTNVTIFICFTKFYRNYLTITIFWFFKGYWNLSVWSGMIQTGLDCHEKINHLERESSKREKSLFLINTANRYTCFIMLWLL